MKAIEQYFHVILFNKRDKIVLTFKSQCVTIQIKAFEQYFHVVLVAFFWVTF